MDYPTCKGYVNLLNNKIVYEAMQNCTTSDFYALQDRHRKYCNYAEQLGNKLNGKLLNNSTNNNI